MVRRGGATAVLATLLVAVLLSGAAPAPAAPDAADASVSVSNFQFTPSTVTIDAGEQVTWTWSSGTHNVQTSDGSETWCTTRSSGSCDRTFSTPGTYAYRCGIHPSMQGTVVVEGAPPSVTIDAPADGTSVDGPFTGSGTAAHPDGITAVHYRIDAGPYVPVDTFAGGTEGAWSSSIDPSGLSAGTHTLTVRATTGGGITGTASVSFVLDLPDQVDLRVAALSTTDGSQSAIITGSFHNAGTVAVAGATVTIEYLYHGTWRTIGTTSVDLPAGATRVRSVFWEAEGKIGSFEVRGIIDPDDSFSEADETNNLRQASVSFVHSAIPGTDPFEPL